MMRKSTGAQSANLNVSYNWRRAFCPAALVLAAACTVPNPNYRGRDAAAVDGAPDPAGKELTSLVFLASNNPGLAADVKGVIDGTMVKATVPFGHHRTLVATFTTTGARVEVGSVPQQSGVTSNVFLAPVVYHVVAVDGSTQDYTVVAATPVQQAYAKASNPDENDSFGASVAVSADGNTLAVGSWREDSQSTGIGGDPKDNSALGSGAVYVFVRAGSGWSQQAYIKASNGGAGDAFGYDVALSADGNTLAVGARFEASGIIGVPSDSSAAGSGAVYVFSRSDATWSEKAYLKASNIGAGDSFGFDVALSADGNTLAVGAPNESSSSTGIDGNQNNDSAFASGAVYVFIRSSAAWSQQAYIKASNTGREDAFGRVALSADGNTLAVSARAEASKTTGVNNTGQADDSGYGSGAVYVFIRSTRTWSQQAYIKASNTDAGDFFGDSVALSADGNTLAVGAASEASRATGINNSGQEDDAGFGSGAVYVFARSGTTWGQQAYIKASNTDSGDYFGISAALSANGNTLAVGSRYEASAASGVDGIQGDNSGSRIGAAYAFIRTGTTWTQQAYIKASNPGSDDAFGVNVSLSADGICLAVGATGEASKGVGVNDNISQSDNSKPGSGAVYVFH